MPPRMRCAKIWSDISTDKLSVRDGESLLYSTLKFVQRHWLALCAASLVGVGLRTALVILPCRAQRAFVLATQTAAVTSSGSVDRRGCCEQILR